MADVIKLTRFRRLTVRRIRRPANDDLRAELDRRLRQAARLERLALLVAHRIDDLRAKLGTS